MKVSEYIPVERVDYMGREFAEFYTARSQQGSGYVVMGRCTDKSWYGGHLVKVCARPVKVFSDGRTQRSAFRREYDAYQFALYLTGTDQGSIK